MKARIKTRPEVKAATVVVRAEPREAQRSTTVQNSYNTKTQRKSFATKNLKILKYHRNKRLTSSVEIQLKQLLFNLIFFNQFYAVKRRQKQQYRDC